MFFFLPLDSLMRERKKEKVELAVQMDGWINKLTYFWIFSWINVKTQTLEK